MTEPSRMAQEAVPARKTWHRRTRGALDASRAGSWQQRLTPDQIRLCDAVLGERLVRNGYELGGAVRPDPAELLRYRRVSTLRARTRPCVGGPAGLVRELAVDVHDVVVVRRGRRADQRVDQGGRREQPLVAALLRTPVRMVCTLVRMGYALLAGAIAAEVAATTAMKYSDGFSRLWPSLLTVLGYVIAFALLAQTLKSVSVGTAYAIWAGVGTAVVAAIGMVFLGEGLNAAKVAGIALIIGGVVVLNLGGAH